MGRCFMSMMGAIHQMERELKAERAAAGRACGVGRRKLFAYLAETRS
jgi:DNA invertase Pin-like site-specific DNA recombinase